MPKRPADGPILTDKGREAQADRDRRLATALRDNLLRRKAQQRARSQPGAPTTPRTDDPEREEG